MSEINQRIALVVASSGLSKTTFAERLNVSQQYVSKLTKEGTPSDRTILDICTKFDVNETWLRTGQGEMFVPKTRDEEIAEFMGDVMSGASDDFRRRFIAVLARLSPREWEILEVKCRELAADLPPEE